MRRLAALAGLTGLAVGAMFVAGVPASAALVTTEAQLRAAWATDSLITLGASITLTDCSPAGGELLRSDPTDLTVEGGGFTITQTCPGERVAETTGGTLTLEDLAVTGGDLVDDTGHDVGGGGIRVGGQLVATRVSIRGNRVTATAPGGTFAHGGGLSVAGLLTLRESTVSGNQVTVTASPALAAGGGIYTVGATIDSSTIADNETRGTAAETGAFGGGIAMGVFLETLVGPLTFTNSTVNGNVAAAPDAGSVGGGILSPTHVQLVYSTVAGNSAVRGANLSADVASPFRSGAVIATASVIADPHGGSNCFFPKDSSSVQFSWITDGSCGGGYGPPTVVNGADPQLGPLADNGGPTLTMLPAPTSPLIDAIPADACRTGDAAAVTTDQRGVTRPQGTGCDIGAVEVVVPAAPPVTPPIAVLPTFTG